MSQQTVQILKTVQILMLCCILRHFDWVFTVSSSSLLRVTSLQRVSKWKKKTHFDTEFRMIVIFLISILKKICKKCLCLS